MKINSLVNGSLRQGVSAPRALKHSGFPTLTGGSAGARSLCAYGAVGASPCASSFKLERGLVMGGAFHLTAPASANMTRVRRAPLTVAKAMKSSAAQNKKKKSTHSKKKNNSQKTGAAKSSSSSSSSSSPPPSAAADSDLQAALTALGSDVAKTKRAAKGQNLNNGPRAQKAPASALGSGADVDGPDKIRSGVITSTTIGVAPSLGMPVWTNGQNHGADNHEHSHNPRKLKIFSGTANPVLAKEISSYLGMELGQITTKRFADGELYVQINESIRGCDVFLTQSTCPPTNETLMELLIMIDACRRASARTVTAVIPYFGYARADRKANGRESIAAKLVANMLEKSGVDRVLVLDLHSTQSVGYFDIPVDHVYGQTVILEYLQQKMADEGLQKDDWVVVSPDVGGVARARAFAKKLDDAPLAIVDKRRSGHNVAEVMNVIGDVDGKVAVLVDDMIDTAGTLAKAAQALKDNGARAVYGCATHPVFSPPAVERLGSGVFEEVVVTNSIPLASDKQFPQLTVLSVGHLIGDAIWRMHSDTSMTGMMAS